MPKALITGGAGFVGRHFSRILLERKFEVHVVDSFYPGSGAISPLSIWPLFNPLDFSEFHFHEIDCRDYFDQNSTTSFDLVIHLAAVVGGRLVIEHNPLAVADDLSIDSQFWKWAIKSKPGRIIHFSSSAAYPIKYQTRSGHIELSEKLISFDGDIGMPDLTYGWAKLTSEYLSRIAGQLHDLNIATFRPFSGYGEDQDLNYPFTALCKRALQSRGDEFQIWGSGEQLRDFVYIDDLVLGVLDSHEALSWNTPMNISSGIGTSFLQLSRFILSAIGKESIPVRVERDKPEGVFARVGNRDLQDQYGITLPTSLEQGILKTLNYMERKLE
jgi:nucleoside-diphosphate-sugar epimerase